VWFPTSPLKAVKVRAPGVNVLFDSGKNPASAAALAARSDVAIVFAYQWMSEGSDLPNLSLADHQDALIEQVAAANPRTIVVLETGTAVLMPWLDKVSGVVEAWYAGTKGADAVAAILFGDVNPSGKLPITFPRSEADLPHPRIVVPPPGAQGSGAVMRTALMPPSFNVTYDEDLKVGYKWYDAQHKPVLFPFGFGLSYTTFQYSMLRVEKGSSITVTFTVTNSGSRKGAEIAEVYASLPANTDEPPKRLIGWSKMDLDAGQSKQMSLTIDPDYLSIYDVQHRTWSLPPGNYTFRVGGSSANLPLIEDISIK
jgi:beta-glucosidase